MGQNQKLLRCFYPLDIRGAKHTKRLEKQQISILSRFCVTIQYRHVCVSCSILLLWYYPVFINFTESYNILNRILQYYSIILSC